MANIRQQRIRAEHRHIRAEINRRLFRAHRVASVMYLNSIHEKSSQLSGLYASAVFSYLADDLAELQRLINQYR